MKADGPPVPDGSDISSLVDKGHSRMFPGAGDPCVDPADVIDGSKDQPLGVHPSPAGIGKIDPGPVRLVLLSWVSTSSGVNGCWRTSPSSTVPATPVSPGCLSGNNQAGGGPSGGDSV